MNPHDELIDALAQARLEQMHLSDRDLRRAPPPWEAKPRNPGWGTSLRVRLGRGLLALGAAIAGEDEAAHAHREAPHAHRVA
jgi:hypothetical protein